MADDSAGAVRRTSRPAREELAGLIDVALPDELPGLVEADLQAAADAVITAGWQRRPVVLLPAEGCTCSPPYADCPHGPEPVDALDLAVWLHAESEWWLGQYKHDVVLWRQQVTATEGERDAARAEVEELSRENRRLHRQVGRLPYRQRDYERARLELRKLNDAMARKNRIIDKRVAERDALRARLADGLAKIAKALESGPYLDPDETRALLAVLQGDQPTEPVQRGHLVCVPVDNHHEGSCLGCAWTAIGDGPEAVKVMYDQHACDDCPRRQPTGEVDRG